MASLRLCSLALIPFDTKNTCLWSKRHLFLLFCAFKGDAEEEKGGWIDGGLDDTY